MKTFLKILISFLCGGIGLFFGITLTIMMGAGVILTFIIPILFFAIAFFLIFFLLKILRIRVIFLFIALVALIFVIGFFLSFNMIAPL